MSSLGKNFRITIFGASHGEAIGVVMEGLPVGFAIDMDALNAFLTRRAPGRGTFATARREGYDGDEPLRRYPRRHHDGRAARVPHGVQADAVHRAAAAHR